MGPLMKDLLRLFVMHIIPLLVAAAVMEAYVTCLLYTSRCV